MFGFRGAALAWLSLWSSASRVSALIYDEQYVGYNLNTNKTATSPHDYWGEWEGHTYMPSPTNWRFPFYTLFLDRFVNGDPTNDNANGTAFEQDVMQTQLRHGGDLQGLIDSLDYIQGMGIKAIYIAGSIMINQPWGSDAYSPLDLTLLDAHFGDITKWREMTQAVHDRGMYVVLDNTMGTMGDLIAFDGYLNSSTPFQLTEHKVQWRDPDRQYLDFAFSEEYNTTCDYPRFWLETGYPVGTSVTDLMNGCYNSEFDQYGDTEAFGVFPDWQRQLSKFASVQDRLREWLPSVRSKIDLFTCMQIAQLDIDGIRLDKATQITIDALGDFAHATRECARALGKENFFIPGEITGGNTFGAIYIGRGRQPDMQPSTISSAVQMTTNSSLEYFIRDTDYNALDAGAFHYSIYRSLTRFLGMDGNLASGYDTPVNWVDAWNEMLLTNDFINPNTGVFDPRHMYGTANQDVFRWPAIKNGTEKLLLGLFITTLHMPGIPLLLWGEEQAFYVLDNTASNYIFGRQAMSAATAWQTHGCYLLGSSSYYQFPVESATTGCTDDWNMRDHRDPAAPIRNIIKHMYQMRENYPSLQDGWFLQQLSNMTSWIQYPGSGTTKTETGLWSTMRSGFDNIQDLSGTGAGNQSVWLVYQNGNSSKTYSFTCSDNDTALIAPFDSGTTVRNLFYPFDTVTLKASSQKLGIANQTGYNGCLDSLTMSAWEFKAYVPADTWVGPGPMITKFSPGHDVSVQSAVKPGEQESIPIEFHFSQEMSCTGLISSMKITSTTEDGQVAQLDNNTVACNTVQTEAVTDYIGSIPTTWKFTANLTNVSNGIHSITLTNVSTNSGNDTTKSVDKFLFRVGQTDNPVVFPRLANYTLGLLHQNSDGSLYVSHKAAGADKFRYSLNWESTWSNWTSYTGGNTTLETQPWTGTSKQKWDGEHVIMQYFSNLTGSSSYIQHADLDASQQARRFPHLFIEGPFNLYGYDAGLKNEMTKNKKTGLWEAYFMTEWPGVFQINVWGMNPDGEPDKTFILGDVDLDGVLDRMPPSSLSTTLVNYTYRADTGNHLLGDFIYPPAPYLGYKVVLNDGDYAYGLVPYGSRAQQMILAFLMIIIPVVTGGLSIWLFMKSFYAVKFNAVGISEPHHFIPLAIRRKLKRQEKGEKDMALGVPSPIMMHDNPSNVGLSADAGGGRRRTVLIATMEYDIEDWEIKIKIGGLGVMAQLMGKNLGHQDLIWVVPCVGGIDYPVDTPAASMDVTILGKPYEIQVQYHTLRNITYVLLDAPVFRAQSKSEPYPARMDDLDSAVYYSAWNQCIALAIQRFPIDLYHINDYHGSLAPVHLLPRTIPCCLSLHNAEFQGLWPMRTKKERAEVCAVYNLSEEVVTKYVQFGDVFNLLHAGASYLRVHQKGFGAVGVSKKYGKRSWARYPIFWGLNKIGNLPNPDPSDTGEWTGEQDKEEAVVNQDFEANRGELKRQAQEWAGLDQNPKADLLVFVGRWSMQKGIDLIADVMPAVLEENPNVQLICVGPVIDLYGKFAALKLDVMMKKYKGRVFSKPEFTALPPFIFSGAEFALIPSRDEPFGLVAVEFGRKGALGIGARVGGLGQMPGWWFTVESTTTTHLLHQFKMAIKEALASKLETRQMMRARSAKQRFPVAQWVHDLETLQGKAIKIHLKEEGKASGRPSSRGNDSRSLFASNRRVSRHMLGMNASESQIDVSTISGSTRPSSPSGTIEPPAANAGLSRKLSLGYRAGPGHRVMKRGRANDSSASLGMGLANEPITDVDEDTDFEDRTMSIYDEYVLSPEELEAERQREQQQFHAQSPGLPGHGSLLSPHGNAFSGSPRTSFANSPRVTQRMLSGQPESDYSLPIAARGSAIYSGPPSPSGADSPGADDVLLPPAPFGSDQASHRASMLSLSSVVGDKTDFKLQKVDPFFTDTQGEYYEAFARSLDNLNGKNSEQLLCIEDYLVKSEKKWFDKFRDAKLGRGSFVPPTPSALGAGSRRGSVSDSFMNETIVHSRQNSENDGHGGSQEENDQFLLGKDYKPPTGLRLIMQYRYSDWPVYSFFLAFGQIIAANSYQITLLSGTVGQTAEKLYITATIYLVSSIVWWMVFIRLKSIYVLSCPFFFYGMAFFLLGMAPFVSGTNSRGWIQNVATGFYSVAASSGSIFFALNFGDEGGSPIKSWVYRACLIQGTQQAYNVVLWWWGDYLNKRSADGLGATFTTASTTMSMITIPVAVLIWACGVVLFLGLPDYYRQKPGKVPSFYTSLFRRKIVMWFFVTVMIQNFFLSTNYGRNWMYLFSSSNATTWEIILLIILFFGGVWALFLWFFGMLSKDHSWILPIFAIGLGAPRWCQQLWACTPIGQYVPWAGSPLGSALFSRSLWLWLGVLDALQGAGFGMILLQTLTRLHIAFTLIAAQVIGSIFTIIARAWANNNTGPGDVFPDFSLGAYPGITKAWFWIGLLFQLAICGGFFTFFRKEQLSKP
ncbi:glycoside hydrolase family 13 protein [Coleophoma crateriformis]|uniref:alpha-1,3-glucan synthase n=1 Tax=Coleophoma crateriformis TaxID=565419 RepID=A0A3D8RP90_9HELO|nr:glycoside hydrolase family 13 protein [Coleophoma crateriformis]